MFPLLSLLALGRVVARRTALAHRPPPSPRYVITWTVNVLRAALDAAATDQFDGTMLGCAEGHEAEKGGIESCPVSGATVLASFEFGIYSVWGNLRLGLFVVCLIRLLAAYTFRAKIVASHNAYKRHGGIGGTPRAVHELRDHGSASTQGVPGDLWRTIRGRSIERMGDWDEEGSVHSLGSDRGSEGWRRSRVE